MKSSDSPRDDRDNGASAVEYALLIAGIAGLLIIVVVALGGQTVRMFEGTCEDLDGEMAATASCQP